MNKDFIEKQKKERKKFRENFFKNYPLENSYSQEINSFVQEIKKYKSENKDKEVKKYEEIKSQFLQSKHDEYMKKLGEDYEIEETKLDNKFKNEKEEQKIKIRETLFEYQNKKKEEMMKSKNNDVFFEKITKNILPNKSFLKNIKNYIFMENKDKKSGFSSKILKFGKKPNLYKLIII